MESKIPLPTDSVYKFYALFGLLLLIFSLGATIYTSRSVNEEMISLLLELETLNQMPEEVLSKPQQMRKRIVERLIEVTRSDRKLYIGGLGTLGAIGVFGVWYGFRKWHKEVQPVADETAKVQLEIAKLQLAKLRSEAPENDA